MGKNKKKTFLYVIGFLTHFLFLCYLHPLTLQAQTKKEEIDITALSKQIEQLGEEKYPDFSSIFEKILSMQFTEVFQHFRRYFRISLLPFNHMEYRTVDFLLHIS